MTNTIRKIRVGGGRAYVINASQGLYTATGEPVVLTYASTANAFDFYISTTGSDSNAGTLVSPWAITAINTKQATYAGKRLGILPGTYDVHTLMGTNESVAALSLKGGTDSSHQTFIGTSDSSGNYSRGTATLDAKGSSGFYGGANNNQSAVLAARSGANFWTVDGIKFTGFSMWAFHVGNSPSGGSAPTNWTIQNCEFTGGNDSFNTTSNGVNCGMIIIYCSQNGTITNNWFHDNVGSTDTQHWSCVYQWSLASTDKTFNTQYTHNTIVASGNLHGKEGGGTDPNQYNTTIAYNYIDLTTNNSTSEYCGSAIEGFMSSGTDVSATLTTWHHNVILANGMALSFDNDNPSHSYVNYPLTVYNNTIIMVGQTTSGFVNGGYTGTGTAHQVSYYNNLYYSNGVAKGTYGWFLTNIDTFNVCDYNIYGNWTGAGIFNTVPSGSNTSAGLTGYTSLGAWGTAIGGKEAHSSTNSINPFTAGGTMSYADLYQTPAGPAYQTGKVGGVVGGATINVGAQDGTGRPGASWVV